MTVKLLAALPTNESADGLRTAVVERKTQKRDPEAIVCIVTLRQHSVERLLEGDQIVRLEIGSIEALVEQQDADAAMDIMELQRERRTGQRNIFIEVDEDD